MLPKSSSANRPRPTSRKRWTVFKRRYLKPKPNSVIKPKPPLAQTLEQLQSCMAAHKTTLNEQSQVNLNQGLATLREESRKARSLLMGIAAGAGVIGIAALIVGILA